jgi:two-component sensor histidine kinase
MQRPYGHRVILSGPKVALAAKQAQALRLMFHEMTTNALKYGALSDVNGTVSVDWQIADSMLIIAWCEHDGPKVAAPAKYNFGSKLISSMISQLRAKFEPTFAETGYCYRISVPLSG